MTTFLTNNAIDLPESTTPPAAPDAGRRKLYVGGDGYLYAVDDAGTAVRLQPTSDQAAALAAYQAALLAAETGDALFKTAEGVEFRAPNYKEFIAVLNLGQNDKIVPTILKDELGFINSEYSGQGQYTLIFSSYPGELPPGLCVYSRTLDVRANHSVIRARLLGGDIFISAQNWAGVGLDGLIINIPFYLRVYDA